MPNKGAPPPSGTEGVAATMEAITSRVHDGRLRDVLSELGTVIGELSVAATDDKESELQANDHWLVQTWVTCVADYLHSWDQLTTDQWDRAWAYLQKCRVALHSVLRFTSSPVALQLSDQARYLDAAFGFNVFFSPEFEVTEMRCEICGHDPRSDACPHLRGHLYKGHLATTRILQGRVTGLSIVGEPANRMAVVNVAGVEHPHDILKAIRTRVCCPFSRFKVLIPARAVFEYRGAGNRNDLCPCNGGRKFKKCCLNKWYTDSRNYHIELTQKHLEINVPTMTT